MEEDERDMIKIRRIKREIPRKASKRAGDKNDENVQKCAKEEKKKKEEEESQEEWRSSVQIKRINDIDTELKDDGDRIWRRRRRKKRKKKRTHIHFMYLVLRIPGNHT